MVFPSSKRDLKASGDQLNANDDGVGGGRAGSR